MLKENLKDAGEIIENILTQPLSIPGEKKEIDLLEAAKIFKPEDAMDSDFRKILMNFLQFPEPAEALIKELELLQEDLKVS